MKKYTSEEIAKYLGNPYEFYYTLDSKTRKYMEKHKEDEFHDERHKLHQMGVLYKKHIQKRLIQSFKRLVVINGSSLLEWDAFGQLQWSVTAYLCAVSRYFGIPIYLIGYGKKNSNDISKVIKKEQVEKKFPEANIIQTWITKIRSQKKAFKEIKNTEGLTYLMFLLNGSLCRRDRNLKLVKEYFDRSVVDYMINSRGAVHYDKQGNYIERCNFGIFYEVRKRRFPTTKLLDVWESENARHSKMYILRTEFR